MEKDFELTAIRIKDEYYRGIYIRYWNTYDEIHAVIVQKSKYIHNMLGAICNTSIFFQSEFEKSYFEELHMKLENIIQKTKIEIQELKEKQRTCIEFAEMIFYNFRDK